MSQLPAFPASDPSANTNLAQNLLVVRSIQDWTQFALAASAHVSRATIAQIEAGLGDPRLSTLQQLASALGIIPALLVLSKRDLLALARVFENPKLPSLSKSPTSTMSYLVGSGFSRNRLEAARIGAELVQQAGLIDPAHSVGAALASSRLPGPVIFVLAQMAYHIAHGGGAAVLPRLATASAPS